ncbi:ead/Ea22-like family protein [Enterobacter kobei]|uniref:ead/Ea22-like family protein n=1 Tax=Enterobacter kobei TaxID=208224 RepID=UPI00237FBC03|nr:ead/Ea22-like family protein [Enterobacter kobei]WDW25035.1 ead/Ea22-like family protein [Enterobacter kobei]
MSNIDKRALREAAEKAGTDNHTQDEWFHYLGCSRPATVLALLDELEAKDKRIAELEAREVKLPNPHAHLIWIQAGHAPDDYWDDVAVSHSEKDKCCDGSDRYPVYTLWEIKEALSAIGINIAAAGKGE